MTECFPQAGAISHRRMEATLDFDLDTQACTLSTRSNLIKPSRFLVDVMKGSEAHSASSVNNPPSPSLGYLLSVSHAAMEDQENVLQALKGRCSEGKYPSTQSLSQRGNLVLPSPERDDHRPEGVPMIRNPSPLCQAKACIGLGAVRQADGMRAKASIMGELDARYGLQKDIVYAERVKQNLEIYVGSSPLSFPSPSLAAKRLYLNSA